jgi:hypothetical protein
MAIVPRITLRLMVLYNSAATIDIAELLGERAVAPYVQKGTLLHCALLFQYQETSHK